MTAISRVERRRGETRRAIVDAAWEIAHTDGIDGLGMRQLAEAVGMRAPSLYEYFPSKDAIFDAMFIEGNRQLADGYATIPHASDVGSHAVLVDASRRFLEFCNADEARFRLMFQRALPGWHPSEAAYALAVENLERLGRLLGECGVPDPESRDLWTAILTGLASQQVTNDPGGERWIRLIDDTVTMFLAARTT